MLGNAYGGDGRVGVWQWVQLLDKGVRAAGQGDHLEDGVDHGHLGVYAGADCGDMMCLSVYWYWCWY